MANGATTRRQRPTFLGYIAGSHPLVQRSRRKGSSSSIPETTRPASLVPSNSFCALFPRVATPIAEMKSISRELGNPEDLTGRSPPMLIPPTTCAYRVVTPYDGLSQFLRVPHRVCMYFMLIPIMEKVSDIVKKCPTREHSGMNFTVELN